MFTTVQKKLSVYNGNYDRGYEEAKLQKDEYEQRLKIIHCHE